MVLKMFEPFKFNYFHLCVCVCVCVQHRHFFWNLSSLWLVVVPCGGHKPSPILHYSIYIFVSFVVIEPIPGI